MQLDALLKLQDVTLATTLSRTEIYRRVKSGSFPPPMELGPNRSAWKASDIQKWIDQLREPGMKGQVERWAQLQAAERIRHINEKPEICK